MRRSLRLISHAVLGAALLAPALVSHDQVKADDAGNYGYSYGNYYPSYNYYGFNGYNYYPNYYPNYNYGYYPNYGYNPYYGYNYYPYYGYYPNYNYGYTSPAGEYRYSNGYLYYILSDGSYYVNYNGQWVRGGVQENNDTNNNNSGFESLRNDPHYRYENGYHYYLKDNGDYYYYANGQWILVEVDHPSPDPRPGSTSTVTSDAGSAASSESSSAAPAISESTSPATSEAGSTAESDAGSMAPSEVDSTVTSDAGSAASSESSSSAPAISESTSPATSETGSTAGSDAGSMAPSEADSTVTSDAGSAASSESNSSGPATSENNHNIPGLDDPADHNDEPSDPLPDFKPGTNENNPHLGYEPDSSIDYDKLPKPTLPPTDPNMQADPRFVDSDGTYYYVVAQTDEDYARGIDGYYKWDGYRWILHNGTASDDPGLDPNIHEHTEDSDYVYDDQTSTFKVYSENVIGNGMAGDPLPFKTVDEFKDYVIRHYTPVFKDNAGWDCKVTWELEDADSFNNSKDAAWARDYVLVAQLKSGVDQEEYKDRELGHIKFIYRVAPDVNSDYVEVDSAKVAFAQINAERKANGLSELTWSEDLYNNTTLPHAKAISRQYDSDGFVDRRETDGKVVANKWLNSGLRDLLLSPDVKEAAVACVIAGDGTYYWTLNYQ